MLATTSTSACRHHRWTETGSALQVPVDIPFSIFGLAGGRAHPDVAAVGEGAAQAAVDGVVSGVCVLWVLLAKDRDVVGDLVVTRQLRLGGIAEHHQVLHTPTYPSITHLSQLLEQCAITVWRCVQCQPVPLL